MAKKLSKKEVVDKYLAELLQVRDDIKEGRYEAANRYTEKDILTMKEEVLNRVVRDLAG